MKNDEETRDKIVEECIRIFPHDIGDVKVTSRRRQDRMKYSIELIASQPQEYIQVKFNVQENDDQSNGKG